MGLDVSHPDAWYLHKPESRLPAICARASGKLLEAHSIGSIFDYNLSVFTVSEIALENTSAAPPAHPVSRTEAGCNGW